MKTRKQIHEIELGASPERVFEILVTPSAIRSWWGASQAIVIPAEGGLWAASWGADEDRPDYVGAARLAVLDPPRRLLLSEYRYLARTGPLPFRADFTTEFTVIPRGKGATLRVVQDGFPADPVADDSYKGCGKGWRETFEGIRRFLATRSA